MNFKQLAKQYQSELFDGILPFWLCHSQDIEYGGYYTCLNRDGQVFDYG
jgi:N-acylglucosamine 2-epimerase